MLFILPRSLASRLTVMMLAVIAIATDVAVVQGQDNTHTPRGHQRGVAALDALGDKLPDVARRHGMSAADLKRIFTEDSSLVLDESSQLYYEDKMPAAVGGDTPASSAVLAASASLSLADTFKLHSRLGSKKIIFIDFDGHLLTGSVWNSSFLAGADLNAPAWTLDGDPTTFNDQERTVIQDIWRRVAEDYAPFDVDVTTEFTGEAALTRSSSTDEYYGTRALVTPVSSLFCTSCGGLAYIGVFNSVGDTLKPALIFPEKLANASKYMAECVSHEAGHNLSLNHDGTTSGSEYYAGHGSGTTGWAPIMGNSYYQNLTQFSRGEYPLANNSEDDVAKIQSQGLLLRPDDHGNTASSATALPTSSVLAAVGVIEQRSDIDVFRFISGGGQLSLDIRPENSGPDLDILVQVKDGNGATIISSNPVDALAVNLTATLASGYYYLWVEGVGKGDVTTGYSDYASVGQYEIFGTLTNATGQSPPAALIQASQVKGDGPLAVNFVGSGSVDLDGTITSYSWQFGDGTSSSELNPSHTYTSTGVYTAQLTVTDNDGLTGSASVAIEVTTVNVAPSAALSLSTASGPAPLTVRLDASQSRDPDGQLVSYTWNFGDGTSQTTAVAYVDHVYTSSGSFSAAVSVIDNRGASATSAAQSVTVNLSVLRVASVGLRLVSNKLEASVQIVGAAGQPISGATVQGRWSGLISGTGSTTTKSNGVAAFVKNVRGKGAVTFTVTSVAGAGFVYDPALNTQSSGSFTLP